MRYIHYYDQSYSIPVDADYILLPHCALMTLAPLWSQCESVARHISISFHKMYSLCSVLSLPARFAIVTTAIWRHCCGVKGKWDNRGKRTLFELSNFTWLNRFPFWMTMSSNFSRHCRFLNVRWWTIRVSFKWQIFSCIRTVPFCPVAMERASHHTKWGVQNIAVQWPSWLRTMSEGKHEETPSGEQQMRQRSKGSDNRGWILCSLEKQQAKEGMRFLLRKAQEQQI